MSTPRRHGRDRVATVMVRAMADAGYRAEQPVFDARDERDHVARAAQRRPALWPGIGRACPRA